MAIRHKRKTTAAYAWQTTDLVDGQLGINTTDGTLHCLNAAGSAVHTIKNAAAFSFATDGTGTLPISKGGTGQTTNTAAMDALAPTTTKGDLIVHNGTDNIRVGVGTNNQVLTADSTAASGVKWATPSGGSPSYSTSTVVVVDDFCGGLYNAANARDTHHLNNTIWGTVLTPSGGGVFAIDSVAGHPGIIQLKKGNSTGTSCLIKGTMNGTSGVGIVINDLDRFAVLVRPTATGSSGEHSVFGFCYPLASNLAGAETTTGIYFHMYNTTVTPYCQNGASRTAGSTTSFAANTWYLFEAVNNGTSWTFYKNGTLFATVTTNLPAAGTIATPTIAHGAGNTFTGVSHADWDMFAFQTKALTRY